MPEIDRTTGFGAQQCTAVDGSIGMSMYFRHLKERPT